MHATRRRRFGGPHHNHHHRSFAHHHHLRRCECSVEQLEEMQRDLEQAVADLAEEIRRKRAACDGTGQA